MTWLYRRLLLAPLVLVVLIALTFALSAAVPGDPFGGERAVDPAVREQLRTHYGLDRPLPVRFVIYLGNIARGDLGPSIHHKGRSVNAIIAEHLPISALLGGMAMLIALAGGITMGTIGALWRRTALDGVTLVTAVMLLSIPPFVVGPVLALVCGLQWGWFPVAGWNLSQPSTLVLPALTLALPFVGRIARLTRTGVQEILDSDALRTARAKGASEARAVIRHALPLGLIPVIGFTGPAVAGLLTGSLVVEKIFQIPGLGREFIESATNRDIPLVLGTVVVYGAFVILCNLLTDVIQAWVDPRSRNRS